MSEEFVGLVNIANKCAGVPVPATLNNTVAAPQESQVAQQLGFIEQDIAGLANRLNVLAAKLQPVLSPALPSQEGSGQAPPEQALCQVANKLRDIDKTIMLLSRAIETMYNRIEI